MPAYALFCKPHETSFITFSMLVRRAHADESQLVCVFILTGHSRKTSVGPISMATQAAVLAEVVNISPTVVVIIEAGGGGEGGSDGNQQTYM